MRFGFIKPALDDLQPRDVQMGDGFLRKRRRFGFCGFAYRRLAVDHLREPAQGFVKIAFERIRQAEIVQRDTREAVVAGFSGFVERGTPVLNRAVAVVPRRKAAQADGVEAAGAQRMVVGRKRDGRRRQLDGFVAVTCMPRNVSLTTQRFGLHRPVARGATHLLGFGVEERGAR